MQVFSAGLLTSGSDYWEVITAFLLFLIITLVFRRMARYKGAANARVCPRCKSPQFGFKHLKSRIGNPKYKGFGEMILFCSNCGYIKELSNLGEEPETEGTKSELEKGESSVN